LKRGKKGGGKEGEGTVLERRPDTNEGEERESTLLYSRYR